MTNERTLEVLKRLHAAAVRQLHFRTSQHDENVKRSLDETFHPRNREMYGRIATRFVKLVEESTEDRDALAAAISAFEGAVS